MATATKTAPAKQPAKEQPAKAAQLPAVKKSRAAAAPATPPAPAAQVAHPAMLTAMDLLARAMDRNMAPEQLSQFMDLAERNRKAEAEQGFTQAMLAFKLELPEIYRNAGAAFTAKGHEVEYDYVTLDRICDAVIPALAQHGIVHRWSPHQPSEGAEAGMICITAILTHKLGHSVSATLKAPADPSGSKNPVQAIGSTTTYLERYTLLAVCGIAVKQQRDDDGHAAGGPVEQQPAAQGKPGQQGERRAQPRATTYVTRGKHPINGPDLTNALLSIKEGRYDYQSLIGYYALTRPQLVQVHAELKLPAPAEEVDHG